MQVISVSSATAHQKCIEETASKYRDIVTEKL